MTSGINKITEIKIYRKIGKRSKSRNNKNLINNGAIYFPSKYIGRKVKIEILKK